MKKLTTEEFIVKAQNLHGQLYDYSKVDYKYSIEKIEIICRKHGSFFQKPNGHLNGWGCRKCGRDIVAKKFARTKEEFIAQSKKIHGDLYNYDLVEYVNDSTKVEIVCSIHGSFWMNGTNHISGKQGCRPCNMGKSFKCSKWLNDIGVPQKIREKKVVFSDGSWIIADAYDIKKSIIYEYWGDYWHGNPTVYDPKYWNPNTKSSMGELFEKTLIKRNKIISNGFHLIEKWETDLTDGECLATVGRKI
jgi:hypothetical protein